jgi:tetratricopeptide (TPR) repeat protein
VKKYSIVLGLFLLPFLSGCSYLTPIVFPQDPLTAEEHNNLGVAYEKEGKYELAIREYKKAINKDSSLVIPLVNMGNVYFKQGKYEEAEKYYLKALKKDEKNIEAANNIASLYITQGKDYKKGLEYLNKATVSLESPPAYALDTLGVLYFRLGDKERAKEMLVKGCEKVGDDEALLKEIETHLKELGEQGCENEQFN